MSADPISCIEDFQTRVARAQNLARAIQETALQAPVDDAGQSLDTIEALADAIDGRLAELLEEVVAFQARIAPVLDHVSAASRELSGGDDEEQ